MKTKEEIREYNKNYYLKTYSGKREKMIKSAMEYKRKHRKQLRKKDNYRFKTDLNYRTLKILRAAQGRFLSGSKSARTMELTGCIYEELKAYISSKFQEGMTWENWGVGVGKWNIDHIIPLSFFDMTDTTEQKIAFHYTNLQPLWAEDNLKKRDKLPHELT